MAIGADYDKYPNSFVGQLNLPALGVHFAAIDQPTIYQLPNYSLDVRAFYRHNCPTTKENA